MTATSSSTADALLGVYRKPAVEFVRGSGVELFDADGKAYLDFVAGIAVNALGYGDAGLEQAMRDALDGGLVHVSNLYRTAPGERLPGGAPGGAVAPRGVFFSFGGGGGG